MLKTIYKKSVLTSLCSKAYFFGVFVDVIRLNVFRLILPRILSNLLVFPDIISRC